jgi:hypothetical protein
VRQVRQGGSDQIEIAVTSHDFQLLAGHAVDSFNHWFQSFEILAYPNGFGESQAAVYRSRSFCRALQGTTMLDRISRDVPLVELRSSVRANHKLPRCVNDHHQARKKLEVLTARFRNALKKSVEGIIEAGRVLIEAKNELEHGQFVNWVVRDLRFGNPQERDRRLSLRKVQILMFLAKNEVIANANHWYAFPPSWRTLWELTQIRPKQRLLELIANGTIKPRHNP